jgi:excisionase family DNA binding protein
MQDIMTPEQVAEYLHLSTDTIYRLIRGRRLAATRIGRSYRVPRGDLDAFLAANSTRSEVRQRMFERVATIRDANPDVTDDSVIADLEQVDATRPSTITYPT